MTEYKHLFGPVNSRRLGISLGVDLIPYKTCTLDCVYCECGVTTELTLGRKDYIPTEDLISELKHFLTNRPKLDYITFSGSGEPTLAKNIGRVIDFIKTNYPRYKIALLTNGTLLYLPEVRKDIVECDLVKISLDALSDEAFIKVNRPHAELVIDKILKGISDFSKNYSGRIWIELFIVAGLNDSETELQKIKEYLQTIKFEKIQLNTLDRPGAEAWVKTESASHMQKIAEFMKPLPVELIGHRSPRQLPTMMSEQDWTDRILSLLNRRPCTKEDLLRLTSLPENELEKLINDLIVEKKINTKQEKRGLFYLVS